MNQSALEANTCNRRQARENAYDQVTIGFGFTSHWLRKWREFSLPKSQSVVEESQSNAKILTTLDLKSALITDYGVCGIYSLIFTSCREHMRY